MRFLYNTCVFALLILGSGWTVAQVHVEGTSIVLSGNVQMVSQGEWVQENKGVDTAFLVINENAALLVEDDFLNQGAVWTAGSLTIDSSYTGSLIGSDTSILFNLGEVNIVGDVDVEDGYYGDTLGARLRLIGASDQEIYSGAGFFVSYLSLENGGRKNLYGGLFADTIDFTNGVLDNVNDSLLVVYGHTVNFSASSYVEGAFATRSANEVWLPVGVNGKFRPVQIPALGDTNFVVAQAFDTPVPTTPGEFTRVVGDNLWWVVNIGGENAYTPTPFAVHYDPTVDTTGMGPSNVQVARAWDDPTGPYELFGGSDQTSTFPGLRKVTSWYGLADSNFLALGAGCDIPFAVTTLLEGAWDEPSGTMADDLQQNGYLSFFENGGSASKTMIPGKSVPTGAVDVIDLIVRESGSFSQVDTIPAWLMSDGTIRDFRTGDSSYVKSCHAVFGNDYHVEVQHRNHLPLMSSGTFTASLTPQNVDLTSADGSNAYGIGYASVFSTPMGANRSGLLAGDARKTTIPVVNAMDMFFVAQDVGNITPGTYLDSDVNLSGGMDATDFNVTQDNAKNIRFSTAP